MVDCDGGEESLNETLCWTSQSERDTTQKPGTRNPEPQTRNPEPGTRNPKSETRNPEPEIRNPKPETRNPKPETRDPKPQTWNPKLLSALTPKSLNPEYLTLRPKPWWDQMHTKPQTLKPSP